MDRIEQLTAQINTTLEEQNEEVYDDDLERNEDLYMLRNVFAVSNSANLALDTALPL